MSDDAVAEYRRAIAYTAECSGALAATPKPRDIAGLSRRNSKRVNGRPRDVSTRKISGKRLLYLKAAIRTDTTDCAAVYVSLNAVGPGRIAKVCSRVCGAVVSRLKEMKKKQPKIGEKQLT